MLLQICMWVLGIILVGFGILGVFVSSHIKEEKKQGKFLPLPWEKGGWLRGGSPKIFNKDDVKYRDGDNT